MRLIDADELIEIINYTFSKPPFSRKTIKHMIDMARTVDAVPVIRCKDCKHWQCDDSESYCDELGIFDTDMNSYCSYAKRKEE